MVLKDLRIKVPKNVKLKKKTHLKNKITYSSSPSHGSIIVERPKVSS